MSASQAQLREAHRVEDLVAGIRDLIPLPQAYVRIRELVADPDTRISELAEVIATDPALTARLLRIANSAFYALPDPVESVHRAVRVLGFQEVNRIALATSALGSLDALSPEHIDIHSFWRQSVYCGLFARKLAGFLRETGSDALFVAGLLHATGIIVLAHQLPADYLHCVEHSRRHDQPVNQVQKALLGFDYADLAAALLDFWQLPKSIIQPIALHTSALEDVDEALRTPAAILGIAATVADATSTLATTPSSRFDSQAVQLTHMNTERLDGLMVETEAELVDVIAALIPGSSS
ncbi:MAG: HDOD domain-containing protein [Pseudomonadota bacterium]